MANPQKEDGYVGISNEIIEHLAKIRIPGEAMQVLWVVFRKTYGWNKKSDHISMSQISEMTGLKRPTVARALKRLLDCGVIKKDNTVIKKDNSQVNKLLFNKDYDQWNLPEKKDGVIKNVNAAVIKKDNEGVIENDTHKRQYKDTSTKEKNINVRFGEIWSKYPKRVGKKAALKHFKATVKTDEDWLNIHKALKIYLACDVVAKGFIQNGSTWFNDWETWLDYEEYNSDDFIEAERERKYQEIKKNLKVNKDEI